MVSSKETEMLWFPRKKQYSETLTIQTSIIYYLECQLSKLSSNTFIIVKVTVLLECINFIF